MSRKDVIDGYMMNEKHVIAEMLYDTITRYENILSNIAAMAEADKVIMDAYEKKWKTECLYRKEYLRDCGKIYKCYVPVEIELPLRTTGINEMIQPASSFHASCTHPAINNTTGKCMVCGRLA